MQYLRMINQVLLTKLTRRNLLKFSFVTALLIGMLAHGFMFANKIPNHDDLVQYADIKGVGIENGRYVLYFFWKVFSPLSTPWLNGILGLLFLGGAAFFLCDAFDCRQVWQAAAVATVMTVFPVNVSVYSYMYQAHVFMLGVMFASAAPWLIRYGGRLGTVWAMLCVLMATGIYQAYLMLAAGFLIIFVIRCAARTDITTARAAWGMAIRCAIAVLGGAALYLVGMRVILATGKVALRSYQGIDSMGQMNWSELPAKIESAYQTVCEWYFTDVPSYATRLMKLSQGGIVLIGAGWLAYVVIRSLVEKRWQHGMLLLICGLLLPVAAAGIYLMGDEIGVHLITLHSIMVVLLLPVLCFSCERSGEKRGHMVKRFGALVLAAAYLCYGFSLVLVDNQAYLRMHMSFTRAQHFMNRLAARIEAHPDYAPGKRLVTTGYLNEKESLIFFEYDIADRFLPFVGVLNEVDYAWPQVAVRMLTQVVGLAMDPVDDWQPTPEQQAVVEAMPCYPAEGSIVFVDDLCIVRFS